jgi:hypothetical protein
MKDFDLKMTPVCLAPITTEPPKDGMTKTKNAFVYIASPNGICELWTGDEPATLI